MTVNLLVLIHGMTTVEAPLNHAQDYEELKHALYASEPRLRDLITEVITVEWGHHDNTFAFANLRDDQKLTEAESYIHERTVYANVKNDGSPQNHIHRNRMGLSTLTTGLTNPIKEVVELFGVTDVIYYCSPDGESAVRQAVYSHVLSKMEPYRLQPDVRLHLVGHSLGVTVGFDFLFGFFFDYGDAEPGYLHSKHSGEVDRERYKFWRDRAQDGTLTFGSMASAAGQLPLTVMRKQIMVDTLARKQTLDPGVIGIRPNETEPKWRMFYDINDILGFPGRRLFNETPAIEEWEVDTSADPRAAHSLYWSTPEVIKQTADLIASNS